MANAGTLHSERCKYDCTSGNRIQEQSRQVHHMTPEKHSLYHFRSRFLSENNGSVLGTYRVLCGVLRVFIFIKHNSPGTTYPASLIYKEKHFGWQGQFHFFSFPLTDKQIYNLMKLPSQVGNLWMVWFRSQIKMEQGG